MGKDFKNLVRSRNLRWRSPQRKYPVRRRPAGACRLAHARHAAGASWRRRHCRPHLGPAVLSETGVPGTLRKLERRGDPSVRLGPVGGAVRIDAALDASCTGALKPAPSPTGVRHGVRGPSGGGLFDRSRRTHFEYQRPGIERIQDQQDGLDRQAIDLFIVPHKQQEARERFNEARQGHAVSYNSSVTADGGPAVEVSVIMIPVEGRQRGRQRSGHRSEHHGAKET